MASANLKTYLGQGLAADRPVAATIAADLYADMTAFYFATDTDVLSMLDASGTPAWVDFSVPAGSFGNLAYEDASAFVLTLLDDADATAFRASIGAIIGTDVQAYSAKLAAYAGGDTPSAFTLGIVDSVDAAAWRTAIGAGTSSTVGTVTSVDASGGTTGLSFTGGPITTSGTLTLGGTLAVANGGTGSATAAGARTNLGAVNIAGDTMTGSLTLSAGNLTVSAGALNVTGATSAAINLTAPTLFAVLNLTSYRNTTSTHASVTSASSYGAPGAPLYIGAANASLLNMNCQVYDESAVAYASSGVLQFLSTSVHSATNRGTKLSIRLTPADSKTLEADTLVVEAGVGLTQKGVLNSTQGTQHPSFTIATLPTASLYPRTIISVSDLGGGNDLVKSDGTNWRRLSRDSYQVRSTDAGGTFTYTYLTSAVSQRLTVPITATRTVTLTAGAPSGATAVFTRDVAATGAFDWAIGSLKNLTPGTWCTIQSDGTNWYLSSYGAL